MKKILVKEDAVSLVSIIVIAIIAIIIVVTVIKAVMGESGVLSKAQSATTQNNESQKMDEISLLLASYKTNAYTSDDDEVEFEKFLGNLKDNKTIQNYWYSNDLIIMKYDNSYVLIRSESKNKEIIGIISLLGDEYAEKAIYNYKKSIDNKNKDLINFEANNLYIISSNVKENCYEYIIPTNSEVTLAIIDEVEINNKNKERPSIELQENSVLNMYVFENIKITSLYNGNNEIIYNEVSDKPGYAGIYVPTGTKLNIYGNSKLEVYGGPAGKGGTYSAQDYSLGNGGGGAGAGIGGNGGSGGVSTENQSLDGGIGGSCGEITLYGNVEVYAYGGAGAEGGNSTQEGAGAGGGYPAAGIGGGGAGRWRCN